MSITLEDAALLAEFRQAMTDLAETLDLLARAKKRAERALSRYEDAHAALHARLYEDHGAEPNAPRDTAPEQREAPAPPELELGGEEDIPRASVIPRELVDTFEAGTRTARIEVATVQPPDPRRAPYTQASLTIGKAGSQRPGLTIRLGHGAGRRLLEALSRALSRARELA